MKSIYIMKDIILYKVVKKVKHGYELVKIPTKYQETIMKNDMLGETMVQYDTKRITDATIHIMSNKEYNKLTYFDVYTEEQIVTHKFLFDTVKLKEFDEPFYNRNDMMQI